MIKRIKGSLFAKVFILTVAVLLCVSFLVYGVLAWYMPQTYSNNLNAALDEQTSDFIYELEHIRMQDSGGLFNQFLQNTTISMVELYTADGVLMETPSNQNDFNDGITGEALGGTSYESAPIISNSYYFSFADGESLTSGKFRGEMRTLGSGVGTIDIYTVRDYGHLNSEHHGTLTGIEKYSQEEFDEHTQAGISGNQSIGNASHN